jgi:hypothetical protein
MGGGGVAAGDAFLAGERVDSSSSDSSLVSSESLSSASTDGAAAAFGEAFDDAAVSVSGAALGFAFPPSAVFFFLSSPMVCVCVGRTQARARKDSGHLNCLLLEPNKCFTPHTN